MVWDVATRATTAPEQQAHQKAKMHLCVRTYKHTHAYADTQCSCVPAGGVATNATTAPEQQAHQEAGASAAPAAGGSSAAAGSSAGCSSGANGITFDGILLLNNYHTRYQ